MYYPPLFDKTSDDAEGVVDRAVSLFQHQLVGAPHQHRHCLSCIGNACDLYTQVHICPLTSVICGLEVISMAQRT